MVRKKNRKEAANEKDAVFNIGERAKQKKIFNIMSKVTLMMELLEFGNDQQKTRNNNQAEF
jgi:hypothetical protein